MTTSRLNITPVDGMGDTWALAGELDAHTAEELARWLAARGVGRGESGLRLDVAGLSFVDSVGLTTLAEGTAAMRARGDRLVLVRPCDAIVRAIRAARLDGQLEVEHLSPSG